jgi:hypothetical protein
MHYSRVALHPDEVPSNCVFLRAIGFIPGAFGTINQKALKNRPYRIVFFALGAWTPCLGRRLLGVLPWLKGGFLG